MWNESGRGHREALCTYTVYKFTFTNYLFHILYLSALLYDLQSSVYSAFNPKALKGQEKHFTLKTEDPKTSRLLISRYEHVTPDVFVRFYQICLF